jgi:hypothetical protein
MNGAVAGIARSRRSNGAEVVARITERIFGWIESDSPRYSRHKAAFVLGHLDPGSVASEGYEHLGQQAANHGIVLDD